MQVDLKLIFNFAINMEIIYKIAILKISGIGAITGRILSDYFGSAEALFKANKKELKLIPGIGNHLLQQLADQKVKQNVLDLAKKEWDWYQQKNIQVISYKDALYPTYLNECHDAPYLIYVLGNLFPQKKNIAVVGSRKCSHYGEKVVAEFIKYLSAFPVNIVSGLAYGVDTFAHQEAVNQQCITTAVFAHGLDRVYPASNRNLAAKIPANGALITEFPIGTNPDRENFPKRNRIVAGMCEAVVLIEAAKNGGALITADIANSYGREVYAIPGKIYDAFSGGCNELIQKQQAQILLSPEDLAKELGLINPPQNTIKEQKTQYIESKNLTVDEKKIIHLLQQKGDLNQQVIALQMQKSIQEVGACLFSLELSGYVKALPGNRYTLC